MTMVVGVENTLGYRLIWVFGIVGPALLALGTYLPLVRTTLGYAYSIVGTPELLIYGIAVLIFALNVVSVKTNNDIVKQLHLVAIALLVGCVIYGVNLSFKGIDWFVTQTAYDAPSLNGTNQDAYWKKLAEFAGPAYHTWFGDLRKLYETWGPEVTMNNSTEIFRVVIHNLSFEQARDLYQAAGISYTVVPLGLVCIVISLGVQIWLLGMLRRSGKVEIDIK
jgi:hypothetical protein